MEKMTAVPVLVVSLFLSSSVLAHSGPGNSGMMGQEQMPMHGQMNGGMMSDEDFDEMHEQMEKMEALMEKILNTKDPKEYQKLMLEHRRYMEKGMYMMGDGMMYGGKYDGQPNGDQEQRLHRLEERLSVMQMMMQQIMEHGFEREKRP